MSSTTEPLRDEGSRLQVVTAGAISGLFSRFVIAPLDVLKIRLQLQYHSLIDPLNNTQTPAGVLRVAREILRHEGITGFWKGNIPAEGLYLSYGAVQFLAYRSTTQALERLSRGGKKRDDDGGGGGERRGLRIPGAALSFVSGAVAGTAATTATYPLDLLRTRFAAQGTDKVYDGLVASVRDITRHEGASGFFRGLSAAVVQIVPYMGLFFALYESLKPAVATIELPFSSGDALAGTVASVVSKTAVFPLDTVRKRLQIQGPGRSRFVGGHRMPVYDGGVTGTVRMIVKREGWRGLYRGLGVGLIKAAPFSAVTMWSYERVISVMRSLE